MGTEDIEQVALVGPIQLPVVDMSAKCLSDPEKRRYETEKLLASFTESGFCLVTGIDGYHEEELLKWTKWFYHNIPEDVKRDQLATKAFNPKNSNSYRGYFPLIPGQLSHKEGYDFGPIFKDGDVCKYEKDNPFKQNTPRLKIDGMEEEIQKFYEVIYKHWNITKHLGDTIMSLMAESAGEEPDYFERMFSKFSMHTFRPLRYPKRIDKIPQAAFMPDGRILSTPAHMDSGFLTLLQTFGSPGLEIMIDNKWYQVEAKTNTLVINLGEQMTAMSNGRFKSTIHRVVDIGRERFSIPFFYEPSCDTNINTKLPKALLPEGADDKYPLKPGYYPFGAFLLNKLPLYLEYASLCEDIPDWMRRKYLLAYQHQDCWATIEGIVTDKKNFSSKRA